MTNTPNHPNDPTARMLIGHNWKSQLLEIEARERLVSQYDNNKDMLTQKAVIYTRVSTTKQKDRGDSLEYQLEACRNYAEHRGIEIVEELVEGAKSAFHNRVEDRPQGAILHRMLFETKEINTVIFIDISRMFRNMGDVCDFTEKLLRENLNIHEVHGTGESDLTNPSQWLGWMMKGLYASYYSMEKQYVARKNNVRKVSQKKRHCHTCFGLDFSDPQNVKVDEEQAEVVRNVFHLYFKENYGMGTIAKIMDENGARGAKGGKFGKGNVHRILQKKDLYESYEILQKEFWKPTIKVPNV